MKSILKHHATALTRTAALLLTLLMLVCAATLPTAAITPAAQIDDGISKLPGNNILLFSCDFLPSGSYYWKQDYAEFVGGASSLRYTFDLEQGTGENGEPITVKNDGFLLFSTTENCCGERSLDISAMNTLVFSLYLSCTPEELKALNFWATGLQITSSGASDREMRMWTLEQILDFYIVGEPTIGWNKVMIPLLSSGDYNGRLDLTEVNYWRFHAIGASVTEQTDITIMLDQMYFTDELAPCMTQVATLEARIFKDLAEIPEFRRDTTQSEIFDLYAKHYQDWSARVDDIWAEIEQVPEHLQYMIGAKALSRLQEVGRSLQQYQKFLEAQEEALKNPPVDKDDFEGNDTEVPPIGGGQGNDQNKQPNPKPRFDFGENKLVVLLCAEIGLLVVCAIVISLIIRKKRKKQRAKQSSDGGISANSFANRIDISNIGR